MSALQKAQLVIAIYQVFTEHGLKPDIEKIIEVVNS
jgi:hypothetical protein